MRAKDGTIEFVKSWIEGRLTKRQYMHYYIVKTQHAQFLMKANDQPDLVAIKDHVGHIFIPDDGLAMNRLDHERAQRNPFFALIADGYKFPYSLVREGSFSTHASLQLAKWKTLDHLAVTNEQSGIVVNVALVEIGDTKYTLETPFRTPESNKAMGLLSWANYEDIRQVKFDHYNTTVPPYVGLQLVQGNPSKLEEVRGAFVQYAGKNAEDAKVDEDWIYIKTDKKLVNEVGHSDIHDIIKTRPMPFHYGIPEDIMNASNAWNRTTYPWNPEQLDRYERKDNIINLHKVANNASITNDPDNWREFLLRNLDKELAQSVVQFIDDDDAWLHEHGYLVSPLVYGKKFKKDVYLPNFSGYALVIEEANPSKMDTHVAYIKGTLLNDRDQTTVRIPQFTKVLPAPHMVNKAHHLKEFIEYVCA